jgi:hypothetical protein
VCGHERWRQGLTPFLGLREASVSADDGGVPGFRSSDRLQRINAVVTTFSAEHPAAPALAEVGP